MSTTATVRSKQLKNLAVSTINDYNSVRRVLHVADDGNQTVAIVFENSNGQRIYEAFEFPPNRGFSFTKRYEPHNMDQKYNDPKLWGDFYKEAF